MTRIIQVAIGPYLGRQLAVAEDSPVTIGRTDSATYAFPADSFLSRLHVTLEWRPEGCFVRDEGSTNGTFRNGERFTEAVLKPGERLLVGKTLLLVTPAVVEKNPRKRKPEALDLRLQEVADAIRKEKVNRYALIDAAQSDEVVDVLKHSHVTYQSLYEGPQAEELANESPYLVDLPERSVVLQTLLKKGWGKCWGVYLSTPTDFEITRRHLRRFLTVETEEGKQLFFRFYDPRILKLFLPTCTPEESAEFFGPIGAWLMENDAGGVVRFEPHTKLDPARTPDPPRTMRLR